MSYSSSPSASSAEDEEEGNAPKTPAIRLNDLKSDVIVSDDEQERNGANRGRVELMRKISRESVAAAVSDREAKWRRKTVDHGRIRVEDDD